MVMQAQRLIWLCSGFRSTFDAYRFARPKSTTFGGIRHDPMAAALTPREPTIGACVDRRRPIRMMPANLDRTVATANRTTAHSEIPHAPP
jgi:hypothetical protein